MVSTHPTPGSILGTRVRRTEDPALLTTGGVYTDDLTDERLSGALHAIFVRSPIAHARIVGIDASQALAMDGVAGVYTSADLGELSPLRPMAKNINQQMLQPLLASDTVRYVGQPVAVVLCEDPYLREDAMELVDVDYDTLPAVVRTTDALRDDVLLFGEAGTNVAVRYGTTGDLDPHAFEACEVVVRQTIENQRVAPAPMETRSAAITWPEGERMTAWVPSQGAQLVRSALARALSVDPSEIHVLTPDVGGAFGARFGVDPEVIVLAWLAREMRRPVRWSESRYENLLAMTHGRGQQQTVTIGGTRAGKIQAYRLEVLQDCGAYPKIAALLPSLTILMAPGTYQFDTVQAIATSVVTNTTPIGAYRGAGRPEATAAVERAVDLFAAEIGMDPADVRRANLLPKFSDPHTNEFGAVYDSGDFAAALDTVLDAAGYRDLRAEQKKRRAEAGPKQLGIGMSCYVEVTGGGAESGEPNENASVEVHADGTATVLTGTSPHGQGHATAWAMIASDQLGIPMEKIAVVHGDTDRIPKGGGTGGSRSLQQGGVAVQQASKELIEKARGLAAERLEVAEADLQFDVGRGRFNVAGVPDAGVDLVELAADGQLLVASVFFAPGRRSRSGRTSLWSKWTPKQERWSCNA